MAVVEKPMNSKMKIAITKTVNGELKNSNKMFSNIKPETTNQTVFGVATQLATLQKNPVGKINRINEIELAEGV